MWFLLISVLLLAPAIAQAESPGRVDQLFQSGSTITTIPWAPGVTTYWDFHGNRATVYEQSRTQSFYHFQDSQGRTSQGFIYNNFAPSRPLEVPLSSPSLPSDPLPSDCRYCR